MKRIVIALLAVSICFGGDNLPAQLEQIKEALQKKYQVYSLEDLHKLKSPAQPSHRTASRDMEDIVGDWMVEEETMGLFVTVGTDQSIEDPYTTLGLAEADGSVTATASDYETELNYLIMGLFDDDGDGDYGTYYPDISSPEECEQYAYDNGYEWDGIFCDADYHGIEPGCYQPGGNDVFEWQDNDESLCDDRSRSRDDHEASYDLWQYDSSCDGWDGAWYIINYEDGDTVATGNGPEGCDSWTDNSLEKGNEYIFQTTTAGDESEDSEYSFVLGRTDGDGGVDTTCSGGANYSCYFYVEDDDGDDWSPEGIITNLNLMEFFMLMFGLDPDSIGVENPVIVGANASATDSGDIVLSEVRALVFSDGEMSELESDSEEAIAATSIDTLTGTVTFNNLSLYDSTGAAVLTLSGTIGPGMMDFVAGQETSFPFLEELFEEDDGDFFVSFYEDSTGMDIEVKYYEDDEYYEGIYVDTSYFTWYATSDSLFLYEEYDDYYYGEGVDSTELEYAIDGDTLVMGASFDPCEDEPMEECLEFASEEIAGLDELEDIESLRISFGRVLMPGSYSAVDPGDGTLPDEFNLYANYPNPFNPVTTIRFDVGSNSGNNTILRIYDITGRNITTLINRQLQTGTYEVRWDARGFPSGLYFSELISGTKRQTQKMILLK